MNYKESKQILEKIKVSQKILINCHRRPDPDSVSSAIAMYSVLKKMGKECHIISPDPLPEVVNFLNYFKEIEIINYKKFNFLEYDLFLILDSPSWDFITGDKDSHPPDNLYKIQIDHHEPREKFTDVSIIDSKVSSCAEILYTVFQDWNINLDKNIATSLLTGIIGDTLCFKIPLTSARTLTTASKLIKSGADRQYITDRLFSRMPLNLVKFFGEVLKRLELDEEHNFIWSSIPNKIFVKYGETYGAKNQTANMFFGSTLEGDFGVLMVEELKNKLMISFRSAGRFNTEKIARELGGGGHKDSSAAVIGGLPFDEAIEKVLKTVREIVKNEKK